MSMDTRTLARATDPATSHSAAAEAAPRSATIRERVGLILWLHPEGMTHDGIIGEYRRQAARLGWKPASDSGIRTRVRELVADGEVVKVEDTAGRSRYGRTSVVWRAAGVQNKETAGHDEEAR